VVRAKQSRETAALAPLQCCSPFARGHARAVSLPFSGCASLFLVVHEQQFFCYLF